MTGIRFGCGEFVPGGEPIIVPNLNPPTPPTIVPDPPVKPTQIPPFIPPTGDPIKFACLQVSPGENPPPPPPGFRYKNGFFQQCFPCDGALNTLGFGPAKNPGPNNPECVFTSKPECEPNCPNPLIPIEPPDPGLTSVGQPGGRPGGGPGGGGFTPAQTTGGAIFFKCRQTIFICPEDIEKPNPRTLRIQHNCVACNSLTPNGSTNLVSTGSPQVVGNKAVQVFQSDCVYTSKAQCENSCPPGRITANFVENCLEPVLIATEPTTGGGTSDPTITTINIAQQAAQDPTLGISVNEPGVSINEPALPNVSIAQGQPSLNEPANPNVVINSRIFHNTYNFFAVNQSQQTTSFTTITSYLDIFKSSVTSEVADLIFNQGSLNSWKEGTLFALTLDDIEVSLIPDLLDAFKIIHKPGGQLVGKNAFLEMIRKHLLTGTLDEIDAEYYKTLARRQLNDTRLQFAGIQDRDISERAGLGLVGSQSVVADSNQLVNIQKRQVRRQRRFLTDINARISNDVIESSQDIDLPLTDIGFDVSTLTGDSYKITIGEGDGYYIPAKLSNGAEVPLLLETDIAKTFYVPPETRFNALTLFKEDPSYLLTASAATNKNEFVAGDTGVTELKPLYFKLDISSVSYSPNTNPLTSRYSGNYVVETNQTVIDEHSKNNGFAITRVNLDYRDPLYRYILDTGKLSLALNDINFVSILDPKDYPGGIRIARNIPFGLIITPVAGSKFNPFNGQSQLGSFEDPFVRSIKLNADINISDLEKSKPQLDEVNLFNNTGNLKVGLAEPADTQNVIYKYDKDNERYINAYFKNGEYLTSATVTAPSSMGASFMIKDVIDYLLDTQSSKNISWYDVIRRMPLNRVGELIYDNDPRLIGELEKGFRQGMSIKFILNTTKDIEDTLLVDDDRTIIKEGDR
tara:strand:+ start:30530 stop:33268 length:2739 start_codon:yes stop_codon:yes gene_type:complete